MKKHLRAQIALATWFCLTVGTPSAEEPADDKTAEEPAAADEATAPAAMATYRPPRRGAPRERVGGGVRRGLAMPEPTALVPNHVGFTQRDAPSVFWRVDPLPDPSVRVFFTLIDLRSRKTVLETELERPAGAGIQRVRLTRYGVTLETGAEYEWSIALVSDMKHRSHDMVTTGYIERLAEGTPAPRGAAQLAQAGLWYDALEALSNRIDQAPGDLKREAERTGLLHQVGLDHAER